MQQHHMLTSLAANSRMSKYIKIILILTVTKTNCLDREFILHQDRNKTWIGPGPEVIKLDSSLRLKKSAMIGCLRTRVRKQPIIALYFESENELKFYNLKPGPR